MAERCGVCVACRGECLVHVAEGYVARRLVETKLIEAACKLVEEHDANELGPALLDWTGIATWVTAFRQLRRQEEGGRDG